MNSKFFKLSVFALLICMGAYAQDTKTITDKKKVFQMDIPTGWDAASEANAFVNMTFIASPDQSGKLSVSVVKGISNLKESYKINRDALKDFKDFTIVEENTENIGAQESMWFICTWTNDDGTKMKGKQYTLKTGGKLFCIQYHVAEPTFDSARETYDRVIQTLRVK